MNIATRTKAQIEKERRSGECQNIFAAIAAKHPEVTKYVIAKALDVRWDRINSWESGVKVPNESGLEAFRRFFAQLEKKGQKHGSKRAPSVKRKIKKA